MGMVVQHNLPAINSHRQLGVNNNSLSKSLEKLSSGFRINRAADDAAGLAISEKMRGQISGLTKASENSQDAISLIQTAEGALQESHSILQRMRELAVQSSNGTYQNEVDRTNIAEEVKALKSELDRISTSTHYNGIQLLDGSMQGARVTTTQGAPADPNKGAGEVAGTSVNGIVAGNPATKASFEIDLTGVSFTTTAANSQGKFTLKDGSGATLNVETLANLAAGTFSDSQLATEIAKGAAGTAGILLKANATDAGTTFKVTANGSKLVFTATTAGESAFAKGAQSTPAAFAAGTHTTGTTAGTLPTGTSNVDSGTNVVLKESNMSFRDSVKENTVFEVNGQKYEVVDKGSTLKNGKAITNAMLMDNLNSALVVDFAAGDVGAQVASALAKALTTATAAGTNTEAIGTAGSIKGNATGAGAGAGANNITLGTGVPGVAGTWQVKTNGNTLTIISGADNTGADVNAVANPTVANNPVAIKAHDAITAATQSIDFQKVEYGMTVKVGDKTYEIVQSGNDVRDDKNTAVVVSDVNNFTSKSVADALFAQLKSDKALAEGYDVKHKAGTSDITITERTPKGDTKAIGVEIGNAGVTFQIGANGKADQRVSLQVDDMSAANLGMKNKLGVTSKSIQDIDVGTRNTANEAIEVIDAAINQVSGTRSTMGALQNRLEHTVKNLDVAAENLTASESRIRDVDMAKEMMNFSKSQITSQAAQAMLAQANTLPQGVLQLLQ